MAFGPMRNSRKAGVAGWLSNIVACQAPRRGEAIVVSGFGRHLSLYVTAVWTPSATLPSKDQAKVVMAGGREM